MAVVWFPSENAGGWRRLGSAARAAALQREADRVADRFLGPTDGLAPMDFRPPKRRSRIV